MAKNNFSDFERDMGRGKSAPSQGEPLIGGEADEHGESTAAFPGTGSTLPQDIGADGFEVEPREGDERDDLSYLADERENIAPNDAFDASSLDISPSFDGSESLLSTVDPNRPDRVGRVDEAETPLDEEYLGAMGESAELSEMPIGSENTTAGELGRYECPNCGFEYDVVVGTTARCPACRFEADLASVIGDEAFHLTFDAVDLDD